MSPRRSSRARPTASALAHHSSSSSTSSTRASSSRLRHHDEALDHETSYREEAAFDTRHRNLSTMADANETEGADNDVDETGSQEDEEITRCICGFQEYQGEDDQADTSDGLFIQCDKCHVWQHGFCVGITDNALAPDNYFCEQCRPNFHKLVARPHGPKTSLYLPLHVETSPIESSQSHKDMTSTKRRSTMNSLDAAYDEAVLQRVLEESKSDAKAPSSRNGTRGRKRGSSEGSEEAKEYKRARTSDSDTPTSVTAESGDEKVEKATSSKSGGKKGRNGTSRDIANPSASSKRTTTRSKAVEKSKDSKKDDSEHSDEFPRASGRNSKTTSTTSPVEEIIPPTFAEVIVPDTPQQSKRTNRATNNHGRRKGNNKSSSYRQSEDPHEVIGSPVMVRDASQNGLDKNPSVNTKDEAIAANGIIEKASKPRIPPPKASITDMNKRVNAIMEFIQRTQLEMASDRSRTFIVKSNTSSPRVAKASPPATAVTKEVAMRDVSSTSAVPQIAINGTVEKQEASMISSMDITAVHSTEMMDSLTRKLVHWQQTFGKMEKV
ncbi:hypothetical protein BGX38DRAFT_1139418 [Terfezia claveryi]|nr:hypothetical protein BGX38DRAFT_1139418 [Terfezia claveryi]